jgi:hypothetical protein
VGDTAAQQPGGDGVGAPPPVFESKVSCPRNFQGSAVGFRFRAYAQQFGQGRAHVLIPLVPLVQHRSETGDLDGIDTARAASTSPRNSLID